ncbi:MAG: hypothetical protein M1815_005625 [Lichina confinis]|nr:MAG: hypothetical protein M1815_005625 [Lichina confinis]
MTRDANGADEVGSGADPPAADPEVGSGRRASTSNNARRRIRALFRRVGRLWMTVATWLKGPDPPHIQTIHSIFPQAQSWPIRLLNRYLPKRRQRFVLLLAFYFCWLLTFSTVLHHSISAGELGEFGKPSAISCLASYWASGNGCGLDGNDCRPFRDEGVAFRCPADCTSTKLLNPHAVGAQELIYQPLVVGGGSVAAGEAGPTPERVYRGDSFVCAAAIHAGIVGNGGGGCGVVRLVGQRDGYVGSSRHGIASADFDSTFPKSFTFDSDVRSECRDLRWELLAVSVVFTCLASLFTTSPAVFFGTVSVGIFFHVGLASDPPNLSDYYSIVSILLGRFLPAAFVALAVYRYCVRRALLGLRAQVEKTVLWLGGCWVGALANYTFGSIPIARLTPRDLGQPGAKAALAIIIVVLVFIVLGQAWFLRLEGRLPRYLALYAVFGVCLGLAVAVPGLNLRIHHYILALLLLPGTAIQIRPSLLYQGLLVGLFVNGVARWGFASILQTPAALLGDGQLGSPLPELGRVNVTAERITFAWDYPVTAANENGTFDGISILVNDVERHRGYKDEDAPLFTWTRPSTSEPLPYYFRFAYMQGGQRGDYTRAGAWQPDGSWTEMLPGPS